MCNDFAESVVASWATVANDPNDIPVAGHLFMDDSLRVSCGRSGSTKSELSSWECLFCSDFRLFRRMREIAWGVIFSVDIDLVKPGSR